MRFLKKRFDENYCEVKMEREKSMEKIKCPRCNTDCEIEEIIDYEEIPIEMAKNGEYFALQIKGDPMEPKFSAGDVVIVRKQEDVDNGDIAIVLVNGNEATVKKIRKFDGGINLIPTNSNYDVITYTNAQIEQLPVRIIGKVVELRAKF